MKQSINPLVWQLHFWDGRIPQMRLVAPNQWRFEYHLFDTENDAKAWLDHNWPGKKASITQQKWNDWYVKSDAAVFDHRANPVK